MVEGIRTGEVDEAYARLHPDQEQVAEVALPAVVAAFEKHMDMRERRDWDPLSYILAKEAGVADVKELWTPEGSDMPLLLPDGRIDPGVKINDGDMWLDEGKELTTVARSGLFINGLTEDNLPYYTSTIKKVLDEHEEARGWVNRWTREENRHGDAFKYYAAFSQWIEPSYLEEARGKQLEGGQVPEFDTIEETFIYTSIQELATKVAHRNLQGHLPEGSNFKGLLGKVAAEEDDHFRVYFDGAQAVREAYPDRFLTALETQIEGFAMPGTGIENFDEHAELISQAGIYDVVDVYNIVQALYQEWDVDSIEPQSPTTEKAKKNIQRRMRLLGKLAERTERSRQSLRENGETKQVANPFPGYEHEPVEVPAPKRAKKVGGFAIRVNNYSDATE